MPGPRHQARELALKILFQLDSKADESPDLAIDYHVIEERAGIQVTRFASELVHGVLDHQERLDAEIAAASRNWRVEQMAKVDRIVLRIAVYEITIARSVPLRAAINESIELAKTFSGEESGRFVNGILGKVAEGVV